MENQQQPSVPPGKGGEDRAKESMRIVLYNMLGLALYTVISKLFDGGFVFDAFIIALQVMLCIAMSIAKRSLAWLLSGILVLIIGFSTCVYVGPNALNSI